MQNSSKQLGLYGEALAAKHLQGKGYTILETNWKFGRLEIDIIAKTSSAIVFVEVKTRQTGAFGEPELFVTGRKQHFMVTAAHQYLTQNNIALEARFDIIAIVDHNNNAAVKHLEGAFYPPV